jgi:hypothetical protein
MTDENDLVTLITYPHLPQAESAQRTLEVEGIESFIADSNMVTNDWFLGNAIGWIKLQVRRSEAEQALAILQKYPRLMKYHQDDLPDDEGLTCLSCSSPMGIDEEKCPKCGWSFSD